RLPRVARGHLPRRGQRRLRGRGLAVRVARGGGARRRGGRAGAPAAAHRAPLALPAPARLARLPAAAAPARGLVPAPVRRAARRRGDPPPREPRARQRPLRRRALLALDRRLLLRDRRARLALRRRRLRVSARAALLRRGREPRGPRRDRRRAVVPAVALPGAEGPVVLPRRRAA